MSNNNNDNQFRDDEIIRLHQACPPRAGLSPSCGPITASGLCSPPRRTEDGKADKPATGTAGRASAEFRLRYPVPLRRTSGSSIILEQLRDGKMVKNIFPKIGGRLRLAHEENDQLSITTEIIKYDENLAVVKAITATNKGSFPGLGMASVERDYTIAS